MVAITGMSVISCGGQGGRPGAMPADGTPASAAAICPDLVALRVALNDLILVRVGPAAGAEIGVRARDAGHRLDVLAARTAGRWRIQVAALRSAIGVVRDAAARLAAHPDSASITAVTQSLQGASAAAEGLLAVITVDCPGSYPPGGPENAEIVAMHGVVYRARPDVGGIVHTHSLSPTTNAVLLANHGLLAFGPDPMAAARLVVAVEDSAEVELAAARIGGGVEFPPGALEAVRESMARTRG